MANKKISELESRASLSLSDLMAVGDPSTGYLYKTTISDLKTLTGAGVVSFNGRFGTVMPAEGDYTLTQLGDVIITSASNGQLLQYNGSNWVNWTPNYLVGNQSITLSGDATGSGTTSIAVTLANSGVTAGSYGSSTSIPVITVDAKGRVTLVSTATVTTTLAALTDVSISSIANNQLLKYNSATSKWENWTPNYLTSYTETDTLNSVTGRGNTTTNDITVGSVTAAGLSNLLGQIKTFVSTGNTYIGASPASASDAGYKLDLNGTARISGDMTMWDDGTNNGNSRALIFRALGSTGNAQTGQILLDGFGASGQDYLQLSASNLRLAPTSGTVTITGTTPSISTVAASGFRLTANSTTNGFIFTQSYNQTSGDLFAVFNNSNQKKISVSYAGVMTLADLSGTGSRMVVADANGVLSTQAIPDLSGYVTLSTTQTITGAKTFSNLTTFNQNIVGGIITLSQGVLLSKSAAVGTDVGYLSLIATSATGLNYINIADGDAPSNTQRFAIPNTNTYTYTLPGASGTVALTSDIPSVAGVYLPLSGGTLTGALNGTSAAFSGGATFGSTVRPITNFAADLGTSSFRWSDIYGYAINLSNSATIGTTLTTGGTIYSGDSVSLGGELYYGGISSNRYLRTYATGTSGSATLNYSFWNGSTWAIVSTLNSSGAATFSSSVRSNSHFIVSDGSSSVVLQGYINNSLRIAESGSGSSGGSRGGLYVGALDGTVATFSGTVTATSLTDNYITIGAAQINRSGGTVELQYAGSGDVRLFGSTATPITFATTGAATFSGSVQVTKVISYYSGGGEVLMADQDSRSTVLRAPGSTYGYLGQVGTYTNHDFAVISGNTPRIYVTYDGRIGINTTNPGHIFDVNGNGRFTGQLFVGAATAATNVQISLNGVSGKAQRIQFQNNGTDQWLLGAGAASETSAFEIYNASGTIALSIAKSNSAATFASDVKVKTLEVTNVGTDATSSGVSTYMRITVNGQNYVIPLHGTP